MTYLDVSNIKTILLPKLYCEGMIFHEYMFIITWGLKATLTNNIYAHKIYIIFQVSLSMKSDVLTAETGGMVQEIIMPRLLRRGVT